MILYFVRHAIAVPHDTPGVAETDRPLTEKGIRKMTEAAEGLRAFGVSPELILTSPLPRAKQTADILVEVLGETIPLQLLPALLPGGRRSEVYQAIQAHSELESIMFVGHQPSLGEIAADIAWGSSDPGIDLKKGGGCAIELRDISPKPRGILIWLLPPSMLRRRPN